MKRFSGTWLLGATVVILACLADEPVVASITSVSSPSQFIGSPTTIDFDSSPHMTIANSLFAGQGVLFGRDDGQNVFIYDWAAIQRVTTSSPNVLGTTSGPGSPSWVTHLNVSFSSPAFEIGAFFGNDQGDGYTQTTLSVFDASNQLLGSVTLGTNNNVSVDQFIGLRSDVPFVSARFQNNGSFYAVALDDFVFSPVASPQVPEPATFIIWSLLGALAITAGRWRQRKATA
jgi:hypothetical protein